MAEGASLQAKAIPSSLIKENLVRHGGKTFLVAENKLSRTTEHQVSFSTEISPFGKEVRNPRVFWTGPISNVKAAEADIFKDGSESVSITWRVDPMEVTFNPNQFLTTWADGNRTIKDGYMEVSPQGKAQDFLSNANRRWCYRFVVVAKSYAEFEIVLETVPTSIENLLKYPGAESLRTGASLIDKWRADCPQILPQECGQGIIPFLQDDRLPQYEKEWLLPTSNTLRHKMWETLSLMGSSAELEDDDLVDYDPSKIRKSPIFPSIPLIEDVGSSSRKRVVEGDNVVQPPTKAGNLDKIKMLLGGSVTTDEVRALNQNLDGDGNGGVQGDNVKTSGNISFDTPASIGMDVTGFMSKMPAGVSRDQVRQMTFKSIKMAMTLSESMGAEDKTEALYRSVTQTRMIPAEEYNRKEKLPSAMFFPGSLSDPSDYWDKHPTRVEPHVTGIPLAHVGFENMVAPLAIERAGDLSIRLHISYFMQHNVNVQQRAPKFKTHRGHGGDMGLSMDENWIEATKVGQIKEAVFAYMFVMADLFPRYYGPRNLLRLLDKHDWLSFRHDQLFALKSVIDGVLARYQYLAVQKKPPLTFKELEDFMDSTLGNIGGRRRKPDILPDAVTREEWNQSGGQSSGRGRGGGRGRGAPSAAAGSAARSQNSSTPPICVAYNKPTGCLRDGTGRMCTLPSGLHLFHLCNKTNSKGEFCLEPHSFQNHK